MRTVIARIFDYSADGVVAEEDTDFFQFCRDLPDDPAQEARTRRLYQDADLHIMGRRFYQGAGSYFPTATDHPYADLMNAGRKIVFSHTLRDLRDVGWSNSVIADGDLAEEVERLRQDGTGHIVAHGGYGFWQSLIRLDLIDEYRLTLFPCAVGQGRRLFGELEKSRPLELLSSNSFTNGCVELEYRRAR